MLTIAAVIATYNRPELLTKRALASVAAQTRLPDCVIVVDDSHADIRGSNAQIMSGLRCRRHPKDLSGEPPHSRRIGRVEHRLQSPARA